MRIALKFTVVMMCVSTFILIVEVALHVQGEQRLLEEDLRARHRAMGQNLRVTLEHVWKHEGHTAALTFIEDERLNAGQTTWRVFKNAPHQTQGILTAQDKRTLASGEQILLKRHHTKADRTTIVSSYWPLRFQGQETRWVLEYAEPVKTVEMRLEDELQRLMLINVWVFALSMLFALIAGYYLVGRPVQLLLKRFEHVKRGDLSVKQSPARRDELGSIRQAFEDMVEHLAATNEEINESQKRQQHMTEQLRQGDRLRSVGTLAAGVAHELGTPLHVIEGRANMIKTDDPNIKKHVKNIIEQSQRMQFIVKHLMDLSRKRMMEPTVVDLNALCLNVIEVLKIIAKEKNMALVFEPTGARTNIKGDSVLLEQALINVVNNAIFASEPEQTITIRMTEDQHRIGVQVEDQGCGMTQEAMTQAMDPFYTTKDVGQGTGLGLSIVYGIVDEHGGAVELHSSTDHPRGTTITLWLPRASKERA